MFLNLICFWFYLLLLFLYFWYFGLVWGISCLSFEITLFLVFGEVCWVYYTLITVGLIFSSLFVVFDLGVLFCFCLNFDCFTYWFMVICLIWLFVVDIAVLRLVRVIDMWWFDVVCCFMLVFLYCLNGIWVLLGFVVFIFVLWFVWLCSFVMRFEFYFWFCVVGLIVVTLYYYVVHLLLDC